MKLQKSLCIALFGLAFAPQISALEESVVIIEKPKVVFPEWVDKKLTTLKTALETRPGLKQPLTHYLYDSEKKTYKTEPNLPGNMPFEESFFESIKRGAEIFIKVNTQTYKTNPTLTDIVDLVNFLFFIALPKEPTFSSDNLFIKIKSPQKDTLNNKLKKFFETYEGTLFGNLSRVPESMFSRDKKSGNFSIHLREYPEKVAPYFNVKITPAPPRNLWFGNPAWKSFAFAFKQNIEKNKTSLYIQPHNETGAIPTQQKSGEKDVFKTNKDILLTTSNVLYWPSVDIKELQKQLKDVLAEQFSAEDISKKLQHTYTNVFQTTFVDNEETLIKNFIKNYIKPDIDGQKSFSYVLKRAAAENPPIQEIKQKLTLQEQKAKTTVGRVMAFLKQYQHPLFSQLNPGSNRAAYYLLMAMISAEENQGYFDNWYAACKKLVKDGLAPAAFDTTLDEIFPEGKIVKEKTEEEIEEK